MLYRIDHAGYALKEQIRHFSRPKRSLWTSARIQKNRLTIRTTPKVVRVAKNRQPRHLICGTGIGISSRPRCPKSAPLIYDDSPPRRQPNTTT